MTADPHIGFVVAAYAIAFIIVAAMIFVIMRDYRTLRRDLARFPGRGERAAGGDEGSS
ncbi:MAG: heme exporter protein CcmD [Methylocella sp.]